MNESTKVSRRPPALTPLVPEGTAVNYLAYTRWCVSLQKQRARLYEGDEEETGEVAVLAVAR